jgi:hypothetical protein
MANEEQSFRTPLSVCSLALVHHLLMGKRGSNLTGLSRYVLDALKQSQANTKDTSENETAIRAVHEDSKPKQYNNEQRPTKRRRTELPVTKRSKYDATGLVPRYKNALQVPDHLQKCALPSNLFQLRTIINP